MCIKNLKQQLSEVTSQCDVVKPDKEKLESSLNIYKSELHEAKAQISHSEYQMASLKRSLTKSHNKVVVIFCIKFPKYM